MCAIQTLLKFILVFQWNRIHLQPKYFKKQTKQNKMRKLSTILALVAVVSLASCKKDYTCECTNVDSFGTTTSSITINGKKKDVEKACDVFEYSYVDDVQTCKIK